MTGKRTGRPLAVALGYDQHPDHAPKVMASGRGAVAEQILAEAFAAGVKVREDADLAEVLTAVEVGDDIPVDAFAAVAEVLVHVYRLNGRTPSFEDDPTMAEPYMSGDRG
ncbi:EscU/YscU/HrcU family type III secretion system export apparatus switch protein [Inquilinus sp. CAU 1745]|uniref:EscU/YscU/HrcU family type III secretion system export apparatus switch protein n=1 Tax=Inquilinus sp. CAU 1745 TaxID=3140369 RepID=UPI00325B2C42